jgi:hypothetical protein
VRRARNTQKWLLTNVITLVVAEDDRSFSLFTRVYTQGSTPSALEKADSLVSLEDETERGTVPIPRPAEPQPHQKAIFGRGIDGKAFDESEVV